MKHRFLQERKLKEVWIVMRIDDYATTPDEGGPNGPFFRPVDLDPKRGGSLWPSKEAALGAARWAAEKWTNRTYGVFFMGYIVNTVRPKVEVKGVKNGR